MEKHGSTSIRGAGNGTPFYFSFRLRLKRHTFLFQLASKVRGLCHHCFARSHRMGQPDVSAYHSAISYLGVSA